MKDIADQIEKTGADEAELCLSYETPDCEHGDLVPFIKFGVHRVEREVVAKCTE
jgi:hypothetical protein